MTEHSPMTKREFTVVEEIIKAAWARDDILVRILLFRLELAAELSALHAEKSR